MTNLIVEYHKIDPSQIKEGRSTFRILAQEAETRNQNRRVYSRKVLEREVSKLNPLAQGRMLMGELDHSMSENINLERVSHLITNLVMERNQVFLEFELLKTPKGLIAKELIEAGVPLGISSRGTGTLIPDDDGFIVGEDYRAITWDLVADPSVKNARLETKLANKKVTEALVESFNNGTLLKKSFDEIILLKDLEKILQKI